MWAYSDIQLVYGQEQYAKLAPVLDRMANENPSIRTTVDQILAVAFAGWWIGIIKTFFNGNTTKASRAKVRALIAAWNNSVESHVRNFKNYTDAKAWIPANDQWLKTEAEKIDTAIKTNRYVTGTSYFSSAVPEEKPKTKNTQPVKRRSTKPQFYDEGKGPPNLR